MAAFPGLLFFLFFLLFSVFFFNVIFFSHPLSMSSSVCFHPFAITNFSYSCEKVKLTECYASIFIYFFKLTKGRTFSGTARQWSLLPQDAIEANSIHAFQKGLGKFMENRHCSDQQTQWYMCDLQFSKFFRSLGAEHATVGNKFLYGWFVSCTVFPKHPLSTHSPPSSGLIWVFLDLVLTFSLWKCSMKWVVF